MDDKTVLVIVGGLSAIIGCLLFVRERRMFQGAETTQAAVVDYESYTSPHNLRMYTMVVEYRLPDGVLIRAKEQAASNRKKYPVGAELPILYSRTKPEMFRPAGSHSRMIGIIGIMVAGIALLALSLSPKMM